MRGWWHELADLVLPAECAGCGRARTTLCDRCRAGLDGARARRVRSEPTPGGVPKGPPVVYAAAAYADEVRAVLLAHKERGALSLVRPLGAALAGAVRAAASAAAHGGGGGGGGGAPGQMLLVPVPSSRRAVAARGHDATRRIALVAAHELRRTGTLARTASVLRQRRPVADQAALGGRERLANLGDALTVVGGPSAHRLLAAAAAVVVVDDLMTTGASLAAATAAVQAAGGRVAAAAVVAAPAESYGGAAPRP